MRGAPHSGLSTLICRIKARRPASSCGRPPRERDFHRQYRRKPARSAGEVKNGTELAFDIPRHVAKMLIEYRDRIAPKIIGHRPQRLFVNADGSAKSQVTVAWLISTYLKRRAGIVLTPHQFRHLSAKVLLDAEPGSFETVKQLLGHKSIKTTVGAYAGIDSRRAARHHQRLVEQALEAQKPMPRRKRRA